MDEIERLWWGANCSKSNLIAACFVGRWDQFDDSAILDAFKDAPPAIRANAGENIKFSIRLRHLRRTGAMIPKTLLEGLDAWKPADLAECYRRING